MTAAARPMRVVKTAAETALADTYAAAKASLPGMPVAREQAFRRFEAQGLPHRRVEAWKYTDLRALMRDAKPLAPLPGARRKRGRDRAARFLRRSRRAGWCLSMAHSCRNCPICRSKRG